MMDLSILDGMDREGLYEYVRSLLWQFRLTDAFWFLKAEEEFGLAAAERLNERVWARLGELGGRDIAKRFGPFEDSVQGFLAAYRYFPWTTMVDYRIETMADGSVEVRVPQCPAQAGRLKHGLGEYVCRHMHQAEFEGFARAVAPSVKVACVFAPPDEHPADCHCCWRFSCEGQTG